MLFAIGSIVIFQIQLQALANVLPLSFTYIRALSLQPSILNPKP